MKKSIKTYKKQENIGNNLNLYMISKSSKLLKHTLTIKEKNQLKCEIINEIFHYYW
jgi:hypothetical protein